MGGRRVDDAVDEGQRRRAGARGKKRHHRGRHGAVAHAQRAQEAVAAHHVQRIDSPERNGRHLGGRGRRGSRPRRRVAGRAEPLASTAAPFPGSPTELLAAAPPSRPSSSNAENQQRRPTAGRGHEPAGAFPGARRLAAGGGRVGHVGRPVRPREIGVDGEHPIRAPPDEAEGLEPPVADQAVEQDGLGERAPLARLVVELHLPEEAELPLLDGLLGEERVRAYPGGTLRVARGRGPLRAAGGGTEQRPGAGAAAHEDDRVSPSASRDAAHLVPSAGSRPKQ